jgi:hypothetical protein
VTAALIGEATLAAGIPGIVGSLDATGASLVALDAAVRLELPKIALLVDPALAASLDVALGDIAAGANFNAQISGGLSVQASLDLVVDAGAWLAGVTAQIQASLDLLASVDASLHLDAAKLAVDAGLQANYSAQADLDASLDASANVSLELQVAIDAAALIVGRLNVALGLALPGLLAYVELTSQLLSAGVVVAHYTGQVQNFGAEVDAVIGTSSLGQTDTSTAVALMISHSDAGALANFRAVFGVTI